MAQLCQSTPPAITGFSPKQHRLSASLKSGGVEASHLTPYVARASRRTAKPTGWLGFHVVACGMSKQTALPIPPANFFLERGDFGDDAAFWCENTVADAIGVADGASGNCLLGYDPGDFSRTLMQLCAEYFARVTEVADAKTLLLKAYDILQEKACYGKLKIIVCTYRKRESCYAKVRNYFNLPPNENLDLGFKVYQL